MKAISFTRPHHKRQRTQNTILRGVGGETLQDRSAQQNAAAHTMHPYYNNNFFARWQEYTRWYMTGWEARKIVDIPVNDALREPVKLEGLTEDDEKRLWEEYEAFNAEKQIRRALIQERLLGGCVLLPIFLRPANDRTDSMLHLHSIRPGDLRAINVVDVAKLSRPLYTSDPFDPYFDKIEVMHIAGTVVHTSRMCILDGDPLFSYSSQRIMENYRFNPCGFGESKLSTLYDALVRATGTQQGAYHLVNLSSCLILTCAHIRAMSAVGSPAKAKLEEVAEQLSIFRAAIVDGKEVEFKQHSATFGSVPELVMSFLQILSAGSDIPATRYLGQSPGGLNATGDSDLENYYNHIGAWQRQCLRPRQLTVFDWLGSNIWGYAGWKARSRNLKLEYEPLWNLDEVQQSQVDNTYGMLIHSLSDLGLISQQSALKELVERKVFKSVPEAGDFLASEMEGAENPFGPGGFGGSGSRDNGREAGSAGSIETRTENTRVYLLNAGEWDESKHSRGEDGKFGSGGASGGKQDITEILGKEHVGVKGKQAIDTLLREEGGHVKGAFERSDIGKIDLAWGDDSFGLKHIMQERVERGIDPNRFVSNLTQVIEKGKLRTRSDGRHEIHFKGKVAIITPELRRNKMTMLLTAFEP